MLRLIASLESTVQGLSWKPGRSTWVSYSKQSTYSPDQSDQKGRIIPAFLEAARLVSFWDLGANTGNRFFLAPDSRSYPTGAITQPGPPRMSSWTSPRRYVPHPVQGPGNRLPGVYHRSNDAAANTMAKGQRKRTTQSPILRR